MSSPTASLNEAQATAQSIQDELVKTRKRTLTRRGVLWLGQTCNLRCYFCYFLNRIQDTEHPEHSFMEIDKAKEICRILRRFYGNTAIDIQGGEPTIYSQILELIRYCREIGLYPTLITNGLVLGKPGVLEQYQEAGIRDFLVSLHGIGEIHDEVVCRKGAYDKIIAAIERMRELDVPFRFNCTISMPVVPVLTEIAQKAIDYGAKAVNFLAFNPFEDQETGIRTHGNVSGYSQIRVELTRAMDMLEENGIEVNVRYLPLCFAEERHRKNFYNFQQLPYDHHEWDYQSWMWTGLQPQRMKEGGLVPPFRIGPLSRAFMYRSASISARYARHPFIGRLAMAAQRGFASTGRFLEGTHHIYRQEAKVRAAKDAGYEHVGACDSCAAKGICDGFHSDYTELFGEDEATAIQGIGPIRHPLHYVREQEKVVEAEDRHWAL